MNDNYPFSRLFSNVKKIHVCVFLCVFNNLFYKKIRKSFYFSHTSMITRIISKYAVSYESILIRAKLVKITKLAQNRLTRMCPRCLRNKWHWMFCMSRYAIRERLFQALFPFNSNIQTEDNAWMSIKCHRIRIDTCM